MTIQEVFGTDKPIIGMLHLRGYDREETMRIAREEIEMMIRCGVDAVLVENYFGDTLDVIDALKMLKADYSDQVVYGVNVLGDFEMSCELAHRYGAKFMQVDSVCGHLNPNRDEAYGKMIAEVRAKYPVFVLGGVRFKYQPVLSGRSLEEDLAIGMTRCDAIVVTGAGTGMDTDIEKISAFRGIMGDFPLIVGAGMTPESAPAQLAIADGGIVGSCFKYDGQAHNPMEEARVRAFMHAAHPAQQD
ncbi:MAG: membrane biogenesis protein [Clostridia bacterium]|nr:membrane biogenesis protein [Clostridia bacterium]